MSAEGCELRCLGFELAAFEAAPEGSYLTDDAATFDEPAVENREEAGKICGGAWC